MSDKHIYAKEIKLDAEYTYDQNHKKVFNVKKLKREFNNFVKILQKK